MQVDRISNRGVSFTADHTTVYLINSDDHVILCDTHMGSEYMDEIKDCIVSAGLGDRELVIFNTHSDWDHVWGNCAFPNALIIAHDLARERLHERGEYDLEQRDRQADIQLRLPNVTFGTSMTLHVDDVDFIHMPGHTHGCAVCLDRRDGVLFVGDLAEDVPVVWEHHVQPWIESLERIKQLPADTILTSHSGVVDHELLDRNIAYLVSLTENNPLDSTAQQYPRHHEANRKRMLVSRSEQAAREKLGERFDFATHKQEVLNALATPEAVGNSEFQLILATSYGDLEERLRWLVEELE